MFRISAYPHVPFGPQAHREATGTVSANYGKDIGDPVAAAEEIAFCRACARFGLGLYLYHEEQVTLH
ncbi:hypothetical protein MLD38_009456 [Melastoma candidum]|uniref:Uncharacterized protein n=1 Tax=Melastoma candidum TaxID=119954 RepID=A0ACB9RY75_9MYRT|nr:hypothetical protein MLD38_009456 [Melastoma candidum]